MIKRKLNKVEEELRKEFSLDYNEVHKLGKLLLMDISKSYDYLINDPDHIWSLDLDLKFFRKLCSITMRLQDNKRLMEEKS